ncbi:hypothetical protein D6833_09985 [Candidatus Parcubacteria bacterium]|nr:MAG: hypothetical protein D6833_09985 [Candidatus Parcubacteria bacterium]
MSQEQARFLDEYARKRTHYEAIYERLLTSAYLPCGRFTREDVQEKLSSLRANRFVVAVCGQMKAGKSTLLNALVFGRPVLPSEATVTTAKITVLQHADREGFSVTFYEPEEWRELCERAERDEGEWGRAFRAEVDKAVRTGAHPETYMGRVLPVDGYEELMTYAATPDLGGVLSPYVKEIRVDHTNEQFKDVLIVDTPGTEDPNQVRERLTKDWIKQADAVVYVIYASQAFNEADIVFLNKYLRHVPPDGRVLAVNKIDLATDIEVVKRWVASLKTHDRPAVRNVAGETGSMAYVCSLGQLISELRKRGLPLGDWEQEQLEILECDGVDWTDPEKNGFPILRKKIEERLLARKGAAILRSHATFIESVGREAVQEMENDILRLQEDLRLTEMEVDDLKKQSEAIRSTIATLAATIGDRRKRLAREIKKNIGGGETEIHQKIYNIFEKVRNKILTSDSKKVIENHLWHLAKELLQLKDSIAKDLQTVAEEVEQNIRNFVDDIWNIAEQNGVTFSKDFFLLEIDYMTFHRELHETITNAASVHHIQQEVSDSLSILDKFLDWFGKPKNTIGKTYNSLTARQEIVKELIDRKIRSVINECDKAIEQLQKKVNIALSDHAKRCETLAERENQAAKRRDDLAAQLRWKESEKAALERWFSELRTGVTGAAGCERA